MSLIENQIDVLTKSKQPGAVVYRAMRDDSRRYDGGLDGFERCESKPDRWNFFKYDYRVVVPAPLDWNTVEVLSGSLNALCRDEQNPQAARQIITQLQGLIAA